MNRIHEKEKKQAYDDRHWTHKDLDEMTERDWRIFKEDFGISCKGIRHICSLFIDTTDFRGLQKSSFVCLIITKLYSRTENYSCVQDKRKVVPKILRALK